MDQFQTSLPGGDTYQIPLDSAIAKKYSLINKMITDADIIIGSIDLLIELRTNRSSVVSSDLGEIQEKLIYNGLWGNAVVTYARFFTDVSKGSGRIKLEKNHHLKGVAEDLLMFHDEIMHVRHNCLAHGQETEYEEANTIMHIHKEGLPDTVNYFLGTKGSKTVSMSIDDLKKFIQLTNHIKESLAIMLEKAKGALNREIEAKQQEIFDSISDYEARKGDKH